MSLRIETSRIEGNILLVALSGAITRWGDRSDDPSIDDLLLQPERKLIVDLAGVDQMDSSGVQLLYEWFAAVRSSGRELRFVGATSRVARLFRITRLDTVLPFDLTIAGACERFSETGNAPGVGVR